MSINFLLRVGLKEEITELFNKKIIRFSCPENWINYAKHFKDRRIGDELECVFARLSKEDKTIYKMYPGYPGQPELNGTVKQDLEDGTVCYSWKLFTQIPTICFYS